MARLFKDFLPTEHELVVPEVRVSKIPLEILLPAAEATQNKFDRSPEYWKAKEELHCKDLCGPDYDHIEGGEFRVQACAWRKYETNRKKMTLEKLVKTGGHLSDEYKNNLASEEHLLMVRIVISMAGGRCRGCNQPATECHHRQYLPETWGKPEEMDDMVAVCRACHTELDKRRIKAAQPKKKKKKKKKKKGVDNADVLLGTESSGNQAG